MKKIFSDNKLYFIVFAMLLTFALGVWSQVDVLVPLQFFSDRRSDWLNYLFIYATMLGEPLIFVVSFFVFLFIKFRYSVLVALSGLVSLLFSASLKIFFQAARPSLVIKEEGVLDQFIFIDGVTINEGFTSFPSGHTQAAFAIFTMIALLSGNKSWWALFCLISACGVAVSRMYLLQHFLSDVIVGAMLGSFIAVGLYWFGEHNLGKKYNWLGGRIRRNELKGVRRLRRPENEE